ncbi:hypothetical protein NEF87_000168 [Candidatus Lokiarchaeum ossiferum]|uniref:AB hydrolase-1 domain-containing protein n=1 Tax=Candidatus Lokiarchaeum ossiferum TaxID=2951803 RepID=A0ABY6HK35_9ARCH|nr:hypothetical protein NEF87_000168 [Candidatus Lokiarchaeum sp. B-35]
MHNKKIMIPNSVGVLEAQISDSIEHFKLGLVLCHPHPQFGGTMTNNVTGKIFHHFSSLGYPCVRFNFRGVGASSGSYSNGVGERQDVKDVCNFFLKNKPQLEKIIIIGYSFGAAIGSSIVDEISEICGFVAISYPFTFIPDFITSSYSNKPKLFIMGDQDDFTSIASFKREYEKYPIPKNQEILEGINHFWNGKEELVIKKIEWWINLL